MPAEGRGDWSACAAAIGGDLAALPNSEADAVTSGRPRPATALTSGDLVQDREHCALAST
jgi:hypothetical protein